MIPVKVKMDTIDPYLSIQVLNFFENSIVFHEILLLSCLKFKFCLSSKFVEISL